MSPTDAPGPAGGQWPGKISLLLSDVDGTLVTKQKVLTPRTQAAVKKLGEAGIAFTVTSSRPPRGLAHLIEPLNLQLPIGGFNGGNNCGKIVACGDDPVAVLACNAELDRVLAGNASATRSQSYFIDITHPQSNKGTMVETMARLLDIPTSEIACIGDMANDILMFNKAGLSIAMGNASDEVKSQAMLSTDTNEEDGLAKAIERYLLGIGP
jgi:hydroxymethylpyrimidine pyrophosphatase-like HAD family hydrolase